MWHYTVKGPLGRSWKGRYSHFLKKGQNIWFSDFHWFGWKFNSAFRFCIKAHTVEGQELAEVYCFILGKKQNFKKPFSWNDLSFWARELGEVSFDSKFLTDNHTSHNFISTMWDLLPDYVTYIEVIKKSVNTDILQKSIKKSVKLFKSQKIRMVGSPAFPWM